MAHITTIQTNGRTDTRVEGRLFRKFARKSPGQRVSAREARRVCVLNRQAGRELEHWGQNQPCFGPKCQHRHHTRDAVLKLIKQGIMKWVGAGENVAAYTDGKEWRPAPSAGYTVLQLV